MRRNFDYHNNNQYGWNTTSHEYVEHITGIERMPSVIPDVPRFPSIYRGSKNQVIREEEDKDQLPRVDHHKHQAPETRKKVHFVEQERAKEVDRNGKSGVHKEVDGNGKREVHKEVDINTAADGFIDKNRKKFALFKLETFKAS